jgi:hypothetical protein
MVGAMAVMTPINPSVDPIAEGDNCKVVARNVGKKAMKQFLIKQSNAKFITASRTRGVNACRNETGGGRGGNSDCLPSSSRGVRSFITLEDSNLILAHISGWVYELISMSHATNCIKQDHVPLVDVSIQSEGKLLNTTRQLHREEGRGSISRKNSQTIGEFDQQDEKNIRLSLG